MQVKDNSVLISAFGKTLDLKLEEDNTVTYYRVIRNCVKYHPRNCFGPYLLFTYCAKSYLFRNLLTYTYIVHVDIYITRVLVEPKPCATGVKCR